MANKSPKFCGIVEEIYELEKNEYEGSVYYNQRISLRYEEGGRDKFLNFVIRGQERIARMADIIAASYNNKTMITVSIDDGANKPSKRADRSCWRVEAGDTTEVEYNKPEVDVDAPFTGITPTIVTEENASPIPANAPQAVKNLAAAVGASETDLPF